MLGWLLLSDGDLGYNWKAIQLLRWERMISIHLFYPGFSIVLLVMCAWLFFSSSLSSNKSVKRLRFQVPLLVFLGSKWRISSIKKNWLHFGSTKTRPWIFISKKCHPWNPLEFFGVNLPTLPPWPTMTQGWGASNSCAFLSTATPAGWLFRDHFSATNDVLRPPFTHPPNKIPTFSGILKCHSDFEVLVILVFEIPVETLERWHRFVGFPWLTADSFFFLH